MLVTVPYGCPGRSLLLPLSLPVCCTGGHCCHHCRLSLLAREVAISAVKCHCLSKPLLCCRGRHCHCHAPPCQRQAMLCLLQMLSSCMLVVIVEVVTAAIIIVRQGGGGVTVVPVMPLVVPVLPCCACPPSSCPSPLLCLSPLLCPSPLLLSSSSSHCRHVDAG